MSDALLIQLMDGAVRPFSRWRAERHIGSCGTCNARYRALRDRSARLHELYMSSAPAVSSLPASWLTAAHNAALRAPARRSPAMRYAAAAAAVLVAAALVPPSFAYVARWLAGRTTPSRIEVQSPSVAPRGAPASEGALPTVQPEVSPSAIRFTPGGVVLTIAFERSERGASLEIQHRLAASVVFEPGGTAGGERPVLILPEGLDVRNAGRSEGLYRLWVPATIRSVRVEVAGRVVATVDVEQPGIEPRRIPLDR